MNDPKRQEIKNRIAAGQQRNAAREQAAGAAATPAGSSDNEFVAFAKEHPLLTVAGGLAVGVLIAGLFPSARRSAYKGGARASALGAAGTHVVLGALNHVLEAAEDAGRAGGAKLGDLGDTLGDTARGARREARHLAEKSSDNARIATRDTSKAVNRLLHRLLG